MALSPKPEDRFDTVEEFQKEMSEYLANPRAGQKQLAAIFRDRDIDEEDEPVASNKSRILEGLTNNIGQTILGRAFAGIASVPLSLAAALNFDVFGGMSPNLGGIIAIVVLIGASIAWPPAGIAACGLALSIALMFKGNFIIGALFAIISGAWGVYSFKKKVANTNTVASFPCLGTFGFAQAAPFITGLFCNIKDALINTAYGFLFCLVLAGLGSHNLVGWEVFTNIDFLTNTNNAEVQDAVFLLLTKPATYI